MATNLVRRIAVLCLGILLAATIVTALLADFFLMPALVLTFHPFGPEGARENAPSLKEAA